MSVNTQNQKPSKSTQINKTFTSIALAFAFFIVLILTLVFGSIALKNLNIYNTYARAQGTIVENVDMGESASCKRKEQRSVIVLGGEDRCKTFKKVVKLKANNKTQRATTDFSQSKEGLGHDIGSKVVVLYDPQDPSKIAFDDYSLWVPMIAVIMLFVFHVALGFVAWKTFKSKE